MNWNILTSKAVNKVAALVTNQSGCAKFDNYINTDVLVKQDKDKKQQLAEDKAKLLELQNKVRELQGFLKFNGKITKTQRGNIGAEIFRINDEISALKKKINPPERRLAFGDYFITAARENLSEREFRKVINAAFELMRSDGLE